MIVNSTINLLDLLNNQNVSKKGLTFTDGFIQSNLHEAADN